MSSDCTPNGGDPTAYFDEKEVRRFWRMLSNQNLAHLYQGVFSAKGGDVRAEYRKLSDVDGLVDLCRKAASEGRSVYAEMGLLDKPPATRATVADVVAVRGFWGEADVKSEGHDVEDGAETVEDVMRFLEDGMPQPPTMIIHSGGGLQWHYILYAPETIEGDVSRRGAIKRNHKRFESASQKVAKGFGVKVDSVADLARPMRIPGTFNPKRGRMARILDYDPDRKFFGRDFAEWVQVNESTRIKPRRSDSMLEEAPAPGPEAIEAAAKVIAEMMPSSDLHNFLVPLCGFLRGWTGKRLPTDDTFEVIDRAWTLAGYPRTGDRAGLWNPLTTTNRRIETGDEVAGGRSLEAIVPGLASKLASALNFDSYTTRALKLAEGLGSAREIYDHMSTFARVDATGLAKVKTVLQEKFGRSFRANDFNRAVKEVKSRRPSDGNDAERKAALLAEAYRGIPIACMGEEKYTDDVAEAMRAMREVNEEGSTPTYFNRGGALVGTVTKEDSKTEIRRYGGIGLTGTLDRTIDFKVWSKPKDSDEWYLFPIAPPVNVVNDLLVNATAEFPPLRGLSEIPVMEPDGTVFNTPGYDEVVGLIYNPPKGLDIPPVPKNPTAEDIERAKAHIADILGDFPYVDKASRTNAIAFLLTAVLRDAIPGNIPFALVDKAQAGTGGSLLAEAVANVAVGGFEAAGAPEDNEEFRKFITSQLDMGARMIVLDNLEGTIDSGVLSRLLTAEIWQDRRLGSTEIITVPNRAVVIGTGNNVGVGGDLPRRTYWIRMNAMMDKPWTRDPEMFTIKDLSSYTKENRGKIVADVLTLARAWYAAGCPEADVSPLGSFQVWARTIGGILAHAGYEDFLGNLDEFYEAQDSEADEWEFFLAAWHETFFNHPLTLETLVQTYHNRHFGDRTNGLPDGSALKEALPTFFGKTAGDQFNTNGFKRLLGQRLNSIKERRYGDDALYVTKGEADTHKKVQRWVVLKGDQKPDVPFEPKSSGYSYMDDAF
jgi:hypothetical protein